MEYLVRRLKADGRFRLAVSTSDDGMDDVFADLAREMQVGCIRGPCEDVLGRLVKVTEALGCENFIRVNAYNALVDIQLLVDMYEAHVAGGYGYSFNEYFEGVPLGTGGDTFSSGILRTLDGAGLAAEQRESVGLYVRQNMASFSVHRVANTFSQHLRCKLAVENHKDFELVDELIYQVPEISLISVMDYLAGHQVLARYNRENPPHEAGVEKLLLNAHKVDAILSKNLPDSTYPISVELTLTNACNLR